ncbi:MAG: DUF2304 domain-containing protein [Alphaproteobacteria bacterium]|nr:DUF2304 domain-containing protein [Alphaproteobacteria bacterium]
MIFQVLLTAVLLGYILYAQTQKEVAYLLSEVTSVASVAGLVLIWKPDLANVLARWVGIGRGADLILYCFVVVGMIVTLNVHLRVNAQRTMITELARSIALASPIDPTPFKTVLSSKSGHGIEDEIDVPPGITNGGKRP